MSDTVSTPSILGLHDIRLILSDEIVRVRSGESTHQQTQAVTNAVGKLLASVKLEMDYLHLSGRKVNIPMLNGGDQ